MALDLDLDRSIVGMWIEAPPYGYIAQWLPRLRQAQGHLIPLRPGLNVLYGRNGAGKTQILDAISLCANTRMSAHEGFILKRPASRSGDLKLPDSPESLLKYYRSQPPDDMDSEFTDYWFQGRSWRGFEPHMIPADKTALVLDIFREFRGAGTYLLTRGMSNVLPSETPFENFPPEPVEPSDIAPPWTMSLVPVLLPNSEAPVTRALLSEMTRSLGEVVADSRREMDEFWERTDLADEMIALEEFAGEQWISLNKWVDEWQWCPLLNRRNLGFAHALWVQDDVDEDVVTEYPHGYASFMGSLAITNSEAPVYLPSIHLEDSQADRRSEWVTGRGSVSVDVPVLKEADAVAEGEALDRLALDSLERYYGKIWNVPEDKYPEFVKGLDVAVASLRRYLTFLPSLANLTHTLLPDGSNAKFREAGYLALRWDRRILVGGAVLVSSGSNAERRWIRLAHLASQRDARWLLMDEPEAGLHRQAEAALAKALGDPPWVENKVLVVATHSPELLNQRGAHLLHVEEGRVFPLGRVDRDRFAELGLRPGDLLSRVRTILLVEGEHEKIVFEELFGEELTSLGVEVLAARGGKNMKDVFDSQFIFRLTGAKVVCLLDNLSAEIVTGVWSQAKAMSQRGETEEAGVFIREALPARTSAENKFLSEFLTQALVHGQHERVIPWGLSGSDVLTYLPAESFGLKKDWQSVLERNRESGESLKPWAVKTYGADFSDERVRSAAQSLDSLPQEFTELLFLLTSLD